MRPGQSVWDFRAQWHWYRFLTESFAFPCHCYSTFAPYSFMYCLGVDSGPVSGCSSVETVLSHRNIKNENLETLLNELPVSLRKCMGKKLRCVTHKMKHNCPPFRFKQASKQASACLSINMFILLSIVPDHKAIKTGKHFRNKHV